MILVIDNYDSFTYNLVQILQGMNEEVRVHRNDQVSVEEVRMLCPGLILISPGPGNPSHSGVSLQIVKDLGAQIPVLGVCLGHQVIAAAFGGRVVRAEKIMHGKTSYIYHDQRTIYRGIPSPFLAVRYHSLLVEGAALPECLEVSAWTDEGEIMGIRHRKYRIEGVQFHPESIMTDWGSALLENFLDQGRKEA